MARIGIIINPYAKQNVRRTDQIVEKLQKIGGEMVDVRATNSLEEIDEVGRSFHEQGVEIVGISGGDGSLSVTLSRLLPIWKDEPFPKLMPLRGGTMNMVCASAGIKKRQDKILAQVVKAMKRGQQIEVVGRDTLQIEGRIGFLFGAGMSANFLDLYYEGHGTGPWKAFRVLIRAIFSTLVMGPFSRRLWERAACQLRFRTDAGATQLFTYRNFTAILASTIENLGIGFRPTYRAFERPRFFHLLATTMHPVRFVINLHHLFFGIFWPQKNTLDDITDHFELVGQKSIRYFLDGELYYTENEDTPINAGPHFEMITMK